MLFIVHHPFPRLGRCCWALPSAAPCAPPPSRRSAPAPAPPAPSNGGGAAQLRGAQGPWRGSSWRPVSNRFIGGISNIEWFKSPTMITMFCGFGRVSNFNIRPGLPRPGKRWHNELENHHVSWENPLFLWLFSIASCMFTRGYHVIFCSTYNVRPPFDSVQLVPITPISLWFMVRK